VTLKKNYGKRNTQLEFLLFEDFLVILNFDELKEATKISWYYSKSLLNLMTELTFSFLGKFYLGSKDWMWGWKLVT